MRYLNSGSVGALLFLVLSIVYGYFALGIKLLPGEENEAFNSQTLPIALSVLGICLSLLELFFSIKKSHLINKIEFPKRRDLVTFLGLIAAVCVYALSLKYIGFLISTIAFMFVCAFILGERKPRTLFLASIVFVVCFWALLKYGLEVYVDPGQLFK